MSESHIRAENISKIFRMGESDVYAVREVSLELRQGEFAALCGSSGSGKTTLLNLLGCIATPSSGRLWIGGRDVGRMNDAELSRFRAEHLGFVFQTFNLLPVLTAAENVEYALLKRVSGHKERRERALKALDLVGLGGLADRRPSQLSGGQRQRVAIARAFVREPQLIIADEPTANLDKATAADVLDLIGRLNESTGSTVILATHDPAAMAKARRRIDISDGKLKAA